MNNSEIRSELSGEFRDFLVEAKQHGYGTPDANVAESATGSKIIQYSDGPYDYVDTFVGGNPYCGFEYVSADVDGKKVPIWSMSYYETLNRLNSSMLGEVLSIVLAQPDPEFPIRGPKEWSNALFSYRYLAVCPKLEAFVAKENIRRGQKLEYEAQFMGGLVNLDKLSQVEDKYWLERGDKEND